MAGELPTEPEGNQLPDQEVLDTLIVPDQR